MTGPSTAILHSRPQIATYLHNITPRVPKHTHTHTQVRFLYLDNKTLANLRHNPQLPKELLLSGSLLRLDAMDSPGTAIDLEPPPRATYCCDNKYRLPGGSTTLTVQLEDIWQHVSWRGWEGGRGYTAASAALQHAPTHHHTCPVDCMCMCVLLSALHPSPALLCALP